MKLWAIYLNLFPIITCTYFFDNNKVNGLTKQQWLTKCTNVLEKDHLQQIIFEVQDLCTQLRCIKNNDEVYIGFDFCMRSSINCKYPEPDRSLPFPECCPKRECDGTRLMTFKEFMEEKKEKKARYNATRRRRGANQDFLVL